MTQPYVYSELPDVIDCHVAGMMREAFLLYGETGHQNHLLYLDRASGMYDEIVLALITVIRAVRSYRGTIAFITQRNDIRALLSSSGMRKHVRVYRCVQSALRAEKRKNWLHTAA